MRSNNLGVIHATPYNEIKEEIEKDFVFFQLYKLNNQYFCACKALIAGKPFCLALTAASQLYQSEYQAKEICREKLQTWAKNTGNKKRLAKFNIFSIYQLSLF